MTTTPDTTTAGRKPALNPSQQASVRRARAALALLTGPDGARALTASVHGEPSASPAGDTAFALGVIEVHAAALLAIIDDLTGQPS